MADVVRLTVTLPRELAEAIERLARAQRYPVSASEVVRVACQEHVNNATKEK
jgi:Arc/MetJ-type ribon-helix-helix transcriptional regulator